MYFVDHTVSATRIRDYGLDGLFDPHRFVRIPKLQYFAFITLLKHCSFVVTDSGGLQDECAFLDKPCLLHRKVTESVQGLGGCVVLSNLDSSVMNQFLAAPEEHSSGRPASNPHPSRIIVDYLENAGYAN
jgi:UDP-N-acetylglucosamine 2-epimerase (non-hydrolysing)